MNLIKRVKNKSIKSSYFNKHKTSYIIIRIVLLPIILIVMLLQIMAEMADKATSLLGNGVNSLTYFIYKIIHFNNLPNKDIEEE